MTATIGDPVSGQVSCSRCGAAMAAGDRFCGECGGALLAPKPSASDTAATGDRAAELAAGHELRFDAPFCRACGVDHHEAASACPGCGRDTGPLRPVASTGLATVHVFRRKLLKRPAVRIGTDGDSARLLLESGEIMIVAVAELPEPAPSPVPDDVPGAPERTGQGALVRLAQACSAGRAKWDPDALVTAAVAAVADDATARAAALDFVASGRPELVERLPLTDSERAWVRAVVAAREDDHAAVVAAVASLPPDGYRPKLALLLRAWRGARAAGADLEPLAPHLAAYADQEPVAALLQRVLGFAGEDSASRVSGLGQVLETGAVPAPLAAAVTGALAALDGDAADPAGEPAHLPASARVLLAHASGRPGLVRAEDVEAVPLAVLDDLVDSGALPTATALEGATSGERARYLRARLAPQELDDADVQALDHADERLRRAFRAGDSEALEVGEDSPLARHYRALDAIRRNKLRQFVPDDVREADRPVVEELRALAGAAAEGVAPSELLTDRLIADPTVWPAIVELAGSTALQPTQELRGRYPAFAEWLSLSQARDFLYLGAWSDAVAAADRCLELAELEEVRDEALSLKACGLHYLGADDRAVQALEVALDGAYSEGLLANMGIVAAQLRPELAAGYLGKLIDEAPTIAMRAAAAHRAVDIWRVSDASVWRNSDSSPLPDAFQDALRRLVPASGLPLEDFRAFVALLAVQDADWLARPRSLAASPHVNSLEGRFYTARANNLIDMIAVMGEAIAGGSPPAWLLHERDSLRGAVVDIMLDNLDEPDSSFGSVALAMADKQVLANPFDDLLLTLLGIAGVTYHLHQQKQEVADHVVARVLDARRRWLQLESVDRENLAGFVELAVRRVAINRMSARDVEISGAIEMFNAAIDQGRYAAPGTYQYTEAMRRIATAASVVRSAREDLVQWPPLLDHAGARADIEKSIEMTRELEHRCLQILN